MLAPTRLKVCAGMLLELRSSGSLTDSSTLPDASMMLAVQAG